MIAEALLLLGLVSVVVLAVGQGAVLRTLLRSVPKGSSSPPVSILKPLKGEDEGLEANLRAVFAQDYPDFEVILGAEDPQDPALAVARRVARDFPRVRSVILGGATSVGGENPKVRILRRLVQSASHDWVLISDSNVRPERDYLQFMVRVREAEDAQLVHTVLVGEGGNTLGGRLEELQLNGWVAASICFAQSFGHPCVIGKSMLLRRSYLTQEGALLRVKDILAEDYTMGRELHLSKKKVALAPYRLPVRTSDIGTRAFLNRHIRWGQMRRRIAPHSFLAELTANATPFLFGAFSLGEPQVAKVAVLLQGVKWLMDGFFYANFSRNFQLKTLFLLPLKDVLVFGMWLVSSVKRTVRWRGNVMLVGPGSRLSPVPDGGVFRQSAPADA